MKKSGEKFFDDAYFREEILVRDFLVFRGSLFWVDFLGKNFFEK